MVVRRQGAKRILPASVLAAATLTLAMLANAWAAAAAAPADADPPMTAVRDGGDRGLPPSPGPTNPNEP